LGKTGKTRYEILDKKNSSFIMRCGFAVCGLRFAVCGAAAGGRGLSSGLGRYARNGATDMLIVEYYTALG
jgi:hypothetical protein